MKRKQKKTLLNSKLNVEVLNPHFTTAAAEKIRNSFANNYNEEIKIDLLTDKQFSLPKVDNETVEKKS